MSSSEENIEERKFNEILDYIVFSYIGFALFDRLVTAAYPTSSRAT